MIVWPAAEGLLNARCVCSACRRLRNDLFVVFSYLMGFREGGARVFPGAYVERMIN